MIESNRDDYDIVLIRQYDAIITSGKYKDVTLNKDTLTRMYPGIKTGSQLVISNEILNVIIGE